MNQNVAATDRHRSGNPTRSHAADIAYHHRKIASSICLNVKENHLTLMVTIANCRDWQETQLLKSKLESSGIKAFVPDEMSNLDGLIMHFGGFRLQVEEDDVAEAKAILQSLGEPEKPANPDGPANGSDPSRPE